MKRIPTPCAAIVIALLLIGVLLLCLAVAAVRADTVTIARIGPDAAFTVVPGHNAAVIILGTTTPELTTDGVQLGAQSCGDTGCVVSFQTQRLDWSICVAAGPCASQGRRQYLPIAAVSGGARAFVQSLRITSTPALPTVTVRPTATRTPTPAHRLWITTLIK